MVRPCHCFFSSLCNYASWVYSASKDFALDYVSLFASFTVAAGYRLVVSRILHSYMGCILLFVRSRHRRSRRW